MDSIWVFAILRAIILVPFLLVVYFSQRFWFVRAWRLIGRVRQLAWRRLLRVGWMAAALVVFASLFDWVTQAAQRIFPHGLPVIAPKPLIGLWLSSAFLAFLAVKLVGGVEWLWARFTSLFKRDRGAGRAPLPAGPSVPDNLPSPSRRYFFQTASYLAGAVPFVGALYGFAAERLRYQLERVDVPIAGLPPALDGLRIVQLSDIHIGGYMPAEQVRRAVEMANELSAELAVVTGDFITRTADPLETCVEELARLRAPLGVWGCNGNHEIYAGAEDYAAELFRRAGMRILRRENVTLAWRGAAINLIGVDYQRTRVPSGRRLPMLQRVEPLVRSDVPNILLSHNPNAFPRAAELGIQLTLAGHTHGGQVQVEILDRRWSPARFITDFISGLYQRPLGAPFTSALPPSNADGISNSTNHESRSTSHELPATSFLYVNRGLGTIGAPVRINVPPEITLLTLHRT